MTGTDARSRAHAWPLRLRLALLAAVLTACVSDDSTVTIKGDVPGLDSLGLRGDSLLALADRSALLLDSMKVAMRAQLAGAELPPVADSGHGALSRPGDDRSASERETRSAAIAASALSAGNAMSQRAQERGDSMARAIAQRFAGSANKDRARADTVRGVLAFQGEEPARSVVLQVGNTTVALSGMATTGLARLVGTEVVVRGMNISPRDIVVSDYIVRGAQGLPAYDGTLLDDGTLRLTDGSGVLRVPLPAALQGVSGVRVWVAVKDGVAASYGLVGRR